MIREFDDHEWFDCVANNEHIHPYVSINGEKVNTRTLFANGAVGLRSDHGGFILIPVREGVVDPHAFFLPQPDRAERALADTIEATRYAFDRFRIDRMEASVPIQSSLRGTGKLLRAVGFDGQGGNKTHDFFWLSKRRFQSLWN